MGQRLEENLRCVVLCALGYKCAFWTSIDRLTAVRERAEWLMKRVGLTVRRHVPAGCSAMPSSKRWKAP